jgi:hypothetical protein
MVLAHLTGVLWFARPGPETSRYMAAQYFVNGVARFAAPVTAALLAGALSRRGILLCGGAAVLVASLLFFLTDRRGDTGERDS